MPGGIWDLETSHACRMMYVCNAAQQPVCVQCSSARPDPEACLGILLPSLVAHIPLLSRLPPPLQAKLLEHNVRFGDPECQGLMSRLDSDLVDILREATRGEGSTQQGSRVKHQG